jgi:hypothetical protein
MPRSDMRLIAPLTAMFTWSSASCDFEVLSSRAGEHVVYHWNADEHWLCGGTVVYADRLAEMMVAHYGMSFDAYTGPTVEYFWDAQDVGSSACPVGRDSCVRATPTTQSQWRSSIYTERAIYPHELAHAVMGFRGHGIPVFVNEGMAVRWQSLMLGDDYTISKPFLLDEPQLRAEIDKSTTLDSNADYDAAYTWFAALELNFGRVKMAEFMQSLSALSSSDKVDDALRRTMGISLAESVALAANYSGVSFDDPVCAMEGVPSIQWVGAPIVIDRRDARCTDEDVVNWNDQVMSLFILEFPDDDVPVNVTVTGASDYLFLNLQGCRGADGPYAQYDKSFQANGPTYADELYGRWVARVRGDIDGEGTVYLPRVEIEPRQP